MPFRRTVVAIFAIGCGVVASAQQRPAKSPSDIDLPPVSWTCPMHPDVVDSKTGNCPICKMNLVSVRLDSIWTCPVHSVIAERKAGKCPIDGRDLIQVTVAVTWTCPGHPEIDQAQPGVCPEGTPMAIKRSTRAHGNHNPQHGGQFFMAPDHWHHLEGALPRAGMFRLYLYDDYTRPMPIDQLKAATGRIVTKERFDNASRTSKEEAAFPLKLARKGSYLEGVLDVKSLPAQIAAKIKFKEDGPEYRFDFTFDAFSKEPRAPSSSASTRAKTPADIAAVPAAATTSTPNQAFAAIEVSIPDTVEEMFAELAGRNERIRELIGRGAFGEVWVPAFQAKELALAIEAHTGQFPEARRPVAESAVKRLVRTAWLLDAYGDLGNRQQLTDAHERFQSAVEDVKSVVVASGR